MAGAGGTGRPTTQHDPQLLDELTRAIAEAIHGPAPQAPTYQPTPYTPQAGFAMARNPQLAPLLANSYQAPGRAQYESQLAAFEAAMSGRQHAITAGVSLANTQQRIGNAPLRFVNKRSIVGPDGQTPRMVVDVYRGNEFLGEHELGEPAYAPGVVQGVPGVSPPAFVERSGALRGQASQIQGLPTPPAPPTAETDYTKSNAYIAGIQALRAAHRALRAQTAGTGTLGRMIGQEAGETKYGTTIAPPYGRYESTVRSVLDTLILKATGLSFPEAAFERYRTELPLATDDETTADMKFRNVLSRIIEEMQGQKRAYPYVGGSNAPAPTMEDVLPSGGQSRSGPTADEILDRALARKRPPATSNP